jgi:hypothetical protein
MCSRRWGRICETLLLGSLPQRLQLHKTAASSAGNATVTDASATTDSVIQVMPKEWRIHAATDACVAEQAQQCRVVALAAGPRHALLQVEYEEPV